MIAALLCTDLARASDRHDELLVEGFTEPFRTVDVAAPDGGIVDEVHVTEGAVVRVGQPLASLDQELHQAQLHIAKENAATKGKLESAKTELTLRRERLSKLEQLSTQGFARPEEVERARGDVRLGEADLLAATEDQVMRKLELERAQVLLDRRHIRSRLNGIVTKVHKEAGEFVAANDPALVTVVQLDPLRLTLSVPRNHAVRLKEKQPVHVRFVSTDVKAKAEVEHVSPLTDAESSTVMVRLTIANPDNKYRAGDRCVMDLRDLTGGVAEEFTTRRIQNRNPKTPLPNAVSVP